MKKNQLSKELSMGMFWEVTDMFSRGSNLQPAGSFFAPSTWLVTLGLWGVKSGFEFDRTELRALFVCLFAELKCEVRAPKTQSLILYPL